MKVKELINYFSGFDENANISILICNLDESSRKMYPVNEICCVSKDKDIQVPFLVISVGEEKPLDEFIESEDGQMVMAQL